MSQVVKISVLHVILLSMTVIGLKNHVTILPGLLEYAKRDAWISVLIAFVIVIPYLFVIWKVHKKSNPPYTWSNAKKIHEKIVVILLILLLYALSASTMIEMLQWVKTTFMPSTPMLVVFALYFVLCVMFASLGLQTIVIVNVVVLAVVVILGFFVAFVNLQVKEYELLLPILEHGWKMPIMSSIFPISGFMELALFLLVQQHIKSEIKFKYFILMALILVGLTLGPLIGAIVTFGPHEASIMRYPAYEEWGIARIGEYINHMDFFSVYQWMTGAFIRIGFYLFLISQLMDMPQQTKKIWTYISVPFALFCLSLLMLDEQSFLYVNNLVMQIMTSIMLLILPAFLYMWSRKKNPSK